MVRLLLLLVVSCSLVGCEPKLIVGERPEQVAGSAGTGAAGAGTGGAGAAGAGEAGEGGDAGAAGAGEAGDRGAAGDAGAAGAQCTENGDGSGLSQTEPVTLPWATGFENGFCDYASSNGFCFSVGTASFRTVTSPVHSGKFAAAFSVNTADEDSNQTRCVRQGTLPSEAYYGAWYYVPALATLESSASLWNLWHFAGGDTSEDGIWDVSLVNTPEGDLQLLVFDFVNGKVRKPATPVAIPIGSWFQIQFYLKRRSDATGEIRLYQDDKLLVEAKDLITDDSSWGQWYVGNIGKGLLPPDSTVYVDDITIGKTRR